MAHLTSPGRDNGYFSTLEVRSRDSSPVDMISRNIRFPRNHYSKAPNVAGGFSMLDLSCKAPAVRANLVGSDISKDGMTIGIETWDRGVMHAAEACWVEHKSGARETHFGQVDTMDIQLETRPRQAEEKEAEKLRRNEKENHLAPPSRRRGLARTLSAASDSGINISVEGQLTKKQSEVAKSDGDQEFETTVTYPVKFRSPPTVVVWLNRLDLPTGQERFQLRADASNISSTQATLKLSTGPSGRLDGAALCWVVFPQEKKSIDSGSFSVDLKGKHTGTVKFREGWFQRPPTVLAALNMFDAAGDADLRVRVKALDITQHGFKWRLESWSDSTLFAASASWIALGFE